MQLHSYIFSSRPEREYSNALHFESLLLSIEKRKGIEARPLYPYQSLELGVIFIYGKDFTRRMNFILIPESVLLLAGLIMLYICLSAAVLCIIRRKFNLRRSDMISAFIDTLIPFIGGGNLRIEHKWEKWFLGILLIGAFFITSLFVGDLLDCVHLILNQKVSTFEQLAKINPWVVLAGSIKLHRSDVSRLLG